MGANIVITWDIRLPLQFLHHLIRQKFSNLFGPDPLFINISLSTLPKSSFFK